MAKYDNLQAILVIIALLVADIVCYLSLSKESYQAAPGDELVITCKDKTGLPVTWRGPRGESIGAKTHPRTAGSSIGQMLIFENTKLSNAGSYVCYSGDQQEKKTFILTVEEPIEIECPTHIIVKEFHDGKLECRIRNNKPHNIDWTGPDGDLDFENKYMKKNDLLIIKNVTKDDNGIVLEATIFDLTGGSGHSRNTTLIVYHKPYHKYMSVDPIYRGIAEEFNLTCEVEANPPPRFAWTQDGRPFHGFVKINDFTTVATIMMEEETDTEYKCEVWNEHGQEQRIFEVHVGGLPDPPTGIALVGNTSKVVEFNVTCPDENEDDLDSQFLVIEYKKLGEESWKYQEFLLNETVIIPKEKLEQKMKYEVRAALKNQFGYSEYTNTTTFETATSVRLSFTSILISLSTLLIIFNT